MDELFERLNKLDTDLINMQGLAIMGFTHVERIRKLVVYGDLENIKAECDSYFSKLEKALSELEG